MYIITHCFNIDLMIIQGQTIHNAIRIQNKSSHHKGSTCQPDTPSHRVLSQLHRSVEGSGTITCQNKPNILATPICDASITIRLTGRSHYSRITRIALARKLRPCNSYTRCVVLARLTFPSQKMDVHAL